jgi:hypothetical protein
MFYAVQRFIYVHTKACWPGYRSQYRDSLRAGWSGDRIPAGEGVEIYRTRPDWPWGPPRVLNSGHWVPFPGVKRPGRGVDHPPAI